MKKNTLHYQVNSRILVLSVGIFILGWLIMLWQANRAVQQEMNSSVNLAKQLITSQLLQVTTIPAWVHQLQTIKETRHLRIQLKSPTGDILESQSLIEKKSESSPPSWFIHLVTSNSTKIEQPLITNEGQQLLLIIEANPLNEISEVWEECTTFFGLLFLLTALIFIVIQVVFNHAIKSIHAIVRCLESLEHEDYQHPLPEFANDEMNLIANAINRLIEKLKESQKENDALTQHTLTIQEDERQNLAQELHDELGQALTAIKVMAATIVKANEKNNLLVAQSGNTIIELCDHLMNVVRSMMQQLHPLTLTELGLKEALKDLIDNWQTRNPKLHIDFEYDDRIEQCPKNFNIHIFRIVQEALNNVVRHANAAYASVSLNLNSQKELLLEIYDDGEGFNQENAKKSGFGLRSMKERVRSLNGKLTLDSSNDEGMKVSVRFPMP
jgi:two-component system sensor histidine kinase UhpB